MERVADLAMDLWIQLGKPRQKEMEGYLFDVLEAVDFMGDEEDKQESEEGHTHE